MSMIDCINCQEFSHDSAFLKTPSQYTFVIYYRYPNHLCAAITSQSISQGSWFIRGKRKKKKMARLLYGTRYIFSCVANCNAAPNAAHVTRCQSDSPGFDVDRESKQGPRTRTRAPSLNHINPNYRHRNLET